MIKTAKEILDEELSAYLKLREQDLPDRIIKCMELYASQFKEKPKQTIEDRKFIFQKKCEEIIGNPVCFDLMTIAFFDYWTEHSDNAKKMRFEKEKVFDIKKRLERWSKNQKTFNNGKSTRTTDDAIRSFITE